MRTIGGINRIWHAPMTIAFFISIFHDGFGSPSGRYATSVRLNVCVNGKTRLKAAFGSGWAVRISLIEQAMVSGSVVVRILRTRDPYWGWLPRLRVTLVSSGRGFSLIVGSWFRCAKEPCWLSKP